MLNNFKLNRVKFVGGMKADKPGRHSNLKCDIETGDYKDQQPQFLMDRLEGLIERLSLAEAAAVVDSYAKEMIGDVPFTEKVFSGTGRAFYSYGGRQLTIGFQGEHSHIESNIKLLDTYRKWHEDAPDCPYAAASYARGLQFTGHSLRGTDYIDEVNDDLYKAMQDKNAQAAEIFAKTYDKFHTHWYWAICYLHASLTADVEFREMWDRFHQCIIANPHDVRNYEIMAFMMMPRWHGSYEIIEDVAKQAVLATEEKYGLMMYARTFSSILEYEYIMGLTYDWPTLKQGYQDWLELFPNDFARTQYASLLYYHEEYLEALENMEALNTLYVSAWENPAEYTIANSICLEFKKSFG